MKNKITDFAEKHRAAARRSHKQKNIASSSLSHQTRLTHICQKINHYLPLFLPACWLLAFFILRSCKTHFFMVLFISHMYTIGSGEAKTHPIKFLMKQYTVTSEWSLRTISGLITSGNGAAALLPLSLFAELLALSRVVDATIFSFSLNRLQAAALIIFKFDDLSGTIWKVFSFGAYILVSVKNSCAHTALYFRTNNNPINSQHAERIPVYFL